MLAMINARGLTVIEGKCLGSQHMERTINVIIRDIASGGDTNSERKKHTQQYTLASKVARDNIEDISFGMKDLEGVLHHHDDALIISTIVENFEGRRILIDNESAANILCYEVFIKTGILVGQLKTVKTPLQGFGGGVIIP